MICRLIWLIQTSILTSITWTCIFGRIIWLTVAAAQLWQVFFSMQLFLAFHSRFPSKWQGQTEPGHSTFFWPLVTNFLSNLLFWVHRFDQCNPLLDLVNLSLMNLWYFLELHFTMVKDLRLVIRVIAEASLTLVS